MSTDYSFHLIQKSVSGFAVEPINRGEYPTRAAAEAAAEPLIRADEWYAIECRDLQPVVPESVRFLERSVAVYSQHLALAENDEQSAYYSAEHGRALRQLLGALDLR